MDRRFVFPWHCPYVVSITLLDFGSCTQVVRLQYLSFPSLQFFSPAFYLLVTTNNQCPQTFSPLANRLLPSYIHSAPGFGFVFLPALRISSSRAKRATALPAWASIHMEGIYIRQKTYTRRRQYIRTYNTERTYTDGTTQIGFYTDGATHRWDIETHGEDIQSEGTYIGRRRTQRGHIYTEEIYTWKGHTHGGDTRASS